MPYRLLDAEFAAMLKVSDLMKRYGYCVKKIADTGSLFLLGAAQGRCVMGPDERGVKMLPIWPHPRFAEDYLARDPVAMASWVGAAPLEFEVQDFLDQYMPRLIEDRYAIAAFAIAPGHAAVVTASEFAANLRYELSQFE